MSLNKALASLLPRSVQSTTTAPPPPPPPPPPADAHPRGLDRVSNGNLRATFRPGPPHPHPQSTVRVVTPEPLDVARDAPDRPQAQAQAQTQTQAPGSHRGGLDSVSPQASPRTIPPAGSSLSGSLPVRRQGLVFNDTFGVSFDGTSSSPPPRQTPFRPRTHTMDGAFRQQFAAAQEARHRVGSFSASSSLPVTEEAKYSPLQPPIESYRPPDLRIHTSTPAAAAAAAAKDNKKSPAARSRLTKRVSSRPTSPLLSPSPSVDSLPTPIATSDANKLLLLMKSLGGRMRGEVEYQREPGGLWRSGVCYIEENKGALMFDPGDTGPFHTPLISDLRGCRVAPVDVSERGHQCLEVVSSHLNVSLSLRPLVPEESDLWLAALLCWQQLPPLPNTLPNRLQTARAGLIASSAGRPEVRRRVSSPGLKEAAIIKVGKVQLWDKAAATSPRAIVRRPSARDLRIPQSSWRKVSCILQDGGRFKLMSENDITVLSVIELSQLARSAIQQLDRSVLDEAYCIAIYPNYATTATQLSVLRPVYLSLESRVLFEVWFVLLRAFTVPDIYVISGGSLREVLDLTSEPAGEVFRLEKTISVRITEAKMRNPLLGSDTGLDRLSRATENTGGAGNYLAEVILDGDVRARTTTKPDTNNPFWREDCDFYDLPSALPTLSVLLKRVENGSDYLSNQLQATLGMPRTNSSNDTLCGTVEVPLLQLDRGRDHEQWLPICNERHQTIGTMLVKVRHEEVVVLLSKNYQPLLKLLHRFNSGLTAQITAALPGNLRRIAEIFLNIFQVSGSATEWLMNMIEDEIDGANARSDPRKPRFSRRIRSNESMESNSDREQIVRDLGKSLQGEANLLFRGNSLLTQALEFHMRRLGREYLEETLAAKIQEINETNPNCEVDPGKIQHGDDLLQNWSNLIKLTTEVWECIASSANRLPPELRQILKYIRTVAEDRYGDFLRTVAYTSVSGFLFLRFICPAILNPKLFGLLRDHPHPRPQRTLTLIAKGLQALANLSTIGKKETWMDPMNRFISAQRQPVRDFLDSVCAIPAERSTNLSAPVAYSTPITVLGRLSPIAREGFPSLPYLVDHARNFAALVKLWVDTNAAKTATYDGDLLEFHTLCLALHQRAVDCFAHIEALRAAESEAAHDADDLPTPPPPCAGSSSELDGHASFARDARFVARVSRTPAEQAPSSGAGGTVRGLRNGPRKFLSGFIRKTRTLSPDGGVGKRDRDRDVDGSGGGARNVARTPQRETPPPPATTTTTTTDHHAL
ncbi:hypothetical protein QBC39DRAFT_393380 [Podospora conica]|nr:hypothetical protein QBC39DRAFT_393380 [Schizothecium conicum]